MKLMVYERFGAGWTPSHETTLAEMREANAEDEETLELLGQLEIGATTALELGGGAQPESRIERADEVVAREANGSRTVRSTRDALAELGARLIVLLRATGYGNEQDRATGVLHLAERAARELGWDFPPREVRR